MEYALKYYRELTPYYEEGVEAFKCGGKAKKRICKKECGGEVKEQACGGKATKEKCGGTMKEKCGGAMKKKKKCAKCGCGMTLAKDKNGNVIERCACGCKK